jgi:hypothetical protein
MPLCPRSVASQGTRPTLPPSIVVIFGLIVEFIKELGGASFRGVFPSPKYFAGRKIIPWRNITWGITGTTSYSLNV